MVMIFFRFFHGIEQHTGSANRDWRGVSAVLVWLPFYFSGVTITNAMV
jgi:hypothetical protein